MTRRFAFGFGVGLAVLCASLASLERFEPTGAAEPLARPEAEARPGPSGSMTHATPGEDRRPRARALASTQDDTHASARAHAKARASASPQANTEGREEAPEAEISSGVGDRVERVTPALELHPAAAAGGTVRFVGFDPDAPRALWLWRIRGERAAVVARTRSEPDGTFAFSPLLLPASGLAAVATPARVKPGEAGASRLRRLAPRTPRAPRGVARNGAIGDWHLQVTPLEASGSVLVGTADEQVIGRFALPELPGALPRALDLSVVPDVNDDSLWLAHELPDGRRSAWRPVHWIEEPEGDER